MAAPEPRLLEGKTALITGAARGIGLAVARAYLDHGANVALADIVPETLEAAERSLESDRVMTLPLDVCNEAATQEAVAAVEARFGGLDIAVPNAGILKLEHGLEMSVASFRQVLEVNLTGAFVTAQQAGRAMRKRGRGGRIVMTSSLFGLRGGRENSAYSASKFGMIGLAQSLAAELAPENILVNCVCPGQIETDMIGKLFADRAALTGQTPDAVRQKLESRIPMGTLGAMDALAGAYVYLASSLSDYVTGQQITVDGGWQVG